MVHSPGSRIAAAYWYFAAAAGPKLLVRLEKKRQGSNL
jgi:hypothetical protein